MRRAPQRCYPTPRKVAPSEYQRVLCQGAAHAYCLKLRNRKVLQSVDMLWKYYTSWKYYTLWEYTILHVCCFIVDFFSVLQLSHSGKLRIVSLEVIVQIEIAL